MNAPRLDAERQRLYGLPPDSDAGPGSGQRCLVITAPATQWRDLARLWQAVQDDLGWPAPAIAVDGDTRLALWFSFSEPQPMKVLHRIGQALLKPLGATCTHPSPGLAWQCWPTASSDQATRQPACPPQALGPERWSAFVAPDLAPMFADSAWLDIPPSLEGQADLLTPLRSVNHEQLAALRLEPEQLDVIPSAETVANPLTAPRLGPRAFLQQVMNDPITPLRWRIEAAKALLPHQPD